MKHIIKDDEPQAFLNWKAMENENWVPTYSSLCGVEKKAVKNSLMKEQGYICCYCERRLTDGDSHIEHFKPQSDPSVDPLDYSNLLCSCQDHLKKGEPRHCGNLKGDWFNSELLISPLESTCENRFNFTGMGGIEPTLEHDNAALETISRLGLNIPKLKDMRAKAIEPFLDDALDEDDFRAFVNGYLGEDDDGKYGEFLTTIQYLFRSYITST